MKSAEVSPATGSLLIRYDAKHADTDGLFAALEQEYRRLGLLDTQSTSMASSRRQANALESRLADRLVDMMVEKCIERSAVALLGALL
jgi:ethanolamine utilization protein EutP (predicted NTPase)